MADLLLADAERAADLRLRQASATARLLNAFAKGREPRAKAGDRIVLLDTRLDRQFFLDNARSPAKQGP
jgi:hypothetical protein